MTRMLLTVISADDTWMLWAIIVAVAAFSIYLEQNFKWASKLSGPVVTLLFTVTLANVGVIPNSAPAYDAMSTYCVPIAVAMLLFKADIRKIIKSTGKAFICFNIGAVGTIIGAFAAFFIVGSFIPDSAKMAGVMTASYIGGGVNFFAVANSVNPAAEIVSASVVADNFVMAIMFFLAATLPGLAWIRKHFKHPFEDAAAAADATNSAKTRAAAYWGKKEMSLLDIAATVAIAFVMAAAADKIAIFLGNATSSIELVSMILGNQFCILTIIAVTFSSLFPKFFSEKLKGGDEIGTFMIYLFFAIIGVPASLKEILLNAPMLFVFCGIIAIINLVIIMLGCKLFKLNVEEGMLASVTTLGGPSSGAALAIAKGWEALVVPGILIGLYGYIIGTPLGLVISNIMQKF